MTYWLRDYLSGDMENKIKTLESQNVILTKRVRELERELQASQYDEDELRVRVIDGLRLYFEHHPAATKENIGSIWKRIKDHL